MGRRIAKTKRHKKLKYVDPCYSGPPGPPKNRKKQFNEPPKEDDYQELPASMQQLIDVTTEIKQNKIKKRKKKKKFKNDFIIVQRDPIEEDFHTGKARTQKPQPKIVAQRRNESRFAFMDRLQHMSDTAIAEAKVEEKYGISVVDIDQSGNAKFVFSEKKLGTRKKEKRKNLEQKKKEKKRKRQKTNDDDDNEKNDEYKKDEVKFGEVVLEPPSFLTMPRKSKETKVGKRDLVLNNFMAGKPATQNTKAKSKMKHLMPAKRQMLERERLRAVDLYRSLKKKKKDSQ